MNIKLKHIIENELVIILNYTDNSFIKNPLRAICTLIARGIKNVIMEERRAFQNPNTHVTYHLTKFIYSLFMDFVKRDIGTDVSG